MDSLKFLSLTAAVLMFAMLASAQKTEPAPGDQQLIQPQELVKVLQSPDGVKPVVLYVGPHLFYGQAHIPGAEYIGPASKPEGMEKLRLRAKTLRPDSFVVIYCGCCPSDHCPNVHPAYDELRKMGFSNVRVLYLATNFGKDWADKGYAVARGE